MELVIINQPRVFPYRRAHQISKRLLDLALCLLFLPVALPLIAICALAIRLDSPGPAFFVQERIGRGGHRFCMYKFRTMRHKHDDSHNRAFMKAFVTGQIGGEEGAKNGRFYRLPRQAPTNGSPGNNGNGKVYKAAQASQITRVGRILRKTSLDELPQLINVLKGDMSIVGPRPNVPWEVEEYRAWHYERLEVLPGLTGLAQVRGRSSISFDRIVQYDIEYVRNQNPLMDLKIMWWTLTSTLLGIGAE